MTRRGPNKPRAEATRRELVAAARDLFLRDGYAAASPNDIAVACGLTKGALYHHFRSKTEVLDAVVRLVQRELRTAVLGQAGPAGDSWDRIEAGCIAYLRSIAATPGLHRLLYADAVAGLGWQRWREIDEQYWSRDLRAALRRALGEDSEEIEPVATIILGTLTQVAAGLARPGPDALTSAASVIRLLVSTLRARTGEVAGGVFGDGLPTISGTVYPAADSAEPASWMTPHPAGCVSSVPPRKESLV